MPNLSAADFALRAPVVIDAPTLDLGPRLWPSIANAAGAAAIPADTVSATGPCRTNDNGLVAAGEYELALTLVKTTVKHATKLELSVALFSKDGALVAWSDDLEDSAKAKPTSSVSIFSPLAKEDLATIQRLLSHPKTKAASTRAARFAHNGRADAVAISPDGRLLVALHTNAKPSRSSRWADVVLWDVASGACLAVTTLKDNAFGLVVTNDRIHTCGSSLWALDFAGNVVTHSPTGSAGARTAIAVATDGRIASVGTGSQPIIVWGADGAIIGRWGIPDPLPPGGDLWMDAISFADRSALRVGQRETGKAWTLDTATGASEPLAEGSSGLLPWNAASFESRVARAEGNAIVVRDASGAEVAKLTTGLPDSIVKVERASTGHILATQGSAVALWTRDLELVHAPIAGTASAKR